MDVKRPLNNIPLHVKWWTVQYCTAVTGERPPVLNSTDLSIFINNHKLNSTLFHTIISNRCTQVMFTDNNYKITDMEIINYNHTLFKEKKKKVSFSHQPMFCNSFPASYFPMVLMTPSFRKHPYFNSDT